MTAYITPDSPGIAAHSSYAQPRVRASYAQPHTGAIKAIYSAIDFSKDGINEVVIGRDTGSLEVYGFDQQHQPALIFQACLEESISSIAGGFFTSPNAQVSHDCTAADLLFFGAVRLVSIREVCYWLRLAIAGTQLQRRGFRAAEYTEPSLVEAAVSPGQHCILVYTP